MRSSHWKTDTNLPKKQTLTAREGLEDFIYIMTLILPHRLAAITVLPMLMLITVSGLRSALRYIRLLRT